MAMNFQQPLLSINKSKFSSRLVCKNSSSLPEINKSKFSSRLVCKNSYPLPEIKTSSSPLPKIKTNKLLVRRISGNIDDHPYFTTLSTTTTDDSDVKGKSNCCSPIIHHNDYISLPFSETLDYNLINFLVGSCDGLVCLSDACDKGYAAMWNPETNDYKMLPDTSVQYPPSAAYSSFPSLGFGFDPKSQDYKMVRFVDFTFETEDGDFDRTEDHAEVYSLKTDSWREVNPPPCVCDFDSVTIDGRCYWGALSDIEYCILCFDFSTEEFLPPIPLPNESVKKYNMLQTLEFDGSLALLTCNVSIGGEYNVWVLDHSSSSWTHVSVIRHSSRNTRPIGFMGNDKLLFESTRDRQLLVYDCVAREMKKSLGIYEDEEYVLQTVPYNNSAADNNYSAPLLLNGKSAAAAAQ